MKKNLLLTIALVTVMVFGLTAGTYAWFTSNTTLNSQDFRTGKLQVSLNGTGSNNTLELSGATQLSPGEIMANPTTIQIVNTGNKNLAWFGKFVYAGPEALKDKLYIDDMQMEFLTPGGRNWTAVDHFITNGMGSGTYAAGYNSIDGLKTNKITLKAWMGNSLMNAFGYETMGALKPGFSYRLSFKLGLLNDTGNTLQDQPVNLSYTVVSTQDNVDAINLLIPGAGSAHYDTFFKAQILNQ